MNRGQRFTFLAIALVIAVVAVVVLADSSEDDTDTGQAAATATATATPSPQEAAPGDEETPTPTATPTPTPKPQPPLLTAGKVTELEFTEGETVRFRVRSDTADHVHVHGYDLMKDVEPGKTTTMSFKATITGIFEIELEDAGTEIGELKVEPE
jgi:heme/copper-type cytochrome/quinol oxidase subunit 2